VTCAYRAYGLSCLSDIQIDGFPAERDKSNPPDVSLIFDSVPSRLRAALDLAANSCNSDEPKTIETEDFRIRSLNLTDGQIFELAYGDGARFVVDGTGKRVWISSPKTLTNRDLAVYVRGPVMGFVLRRRCITALHASCVSVGGQGIVFCGPSEAGKSTLAAALALLGNPVLCEDIAALAQGTMGFHVDAGHSRICLWPDIVRDLFGTADALPRLTPSWDKRFLELDGKRAIFAGRRHPLGAIYLISPRCSESDAPRIEYLEKSEALLALVQNTYMNWVLNTRQRAEEFDALSKVVSEVPVRRIVPHSDPALIERLCELILTDAHDLFSSQNSVDMALSR
jgi:hypothetical protein